MSLEREIEAPYLRDDIPHFQIGDTLEIKFKIREGEKERLQGFTGTLIRRRGGGTRETITVRRIVDGEGVERIFPLHSPKIGAISVLRHGKVRRAKLYYLRDRVGKATRGKEELFRDAKLAGEEPGAKKKKKKKKKKKGAAAAQSAAPASTPPVNEPPAEATEAGAGAES